MVYNGCLPGGTCDNESGPLATEQARVDKTSPETFNKNLLIKIIILAFLSMTIIFSIPQ